MLMNIGETIFMIIVVIRAIILYLVVLVSMRIMGKGELGEMQPFDMAITLMIAELAALPMGDLDAPLVHGIVAIVVLMTLQVLISFLTLKSKKARTLICGKPSILFEHGKFNSQEMKRLRINTNDLIEQIRLKGNENINDVDFVIMETNGDISVIAPQKVPMKKCNRIPISVIIDGKIIKYNIEKYKINLNLIESELRIQNKEIKNIMYGFIDENDNIIFHEKQELK